MILLTLSLLLATAGGVAHAAADEKLDARLTPETVASVLVPKMDQPPVVDGVIDEKEWSSAAAMGGLVNQGNNMMIPRPGIFYLGWDEGHFYLACRIYLPANYKPVIPNGRSPGLAYIWDDALELHFQPMGKNVAADKQRSSYKFFLNALGFMGDYTHLTLGQQFKSWGPKFIVKTRQTSEGTAPNGGSWWEMEMSSTPQDFDLTGPHRAGDQWKMMLGANHMPKWMQAQLPSIGSYLDPFGYGVFTFVDDAPAAQMRMDSLSNVVSDGQTATEIRLHNATKNAVNVKLDVNVADEIKENQSITLKPDESKVVAINKQLSDKIAQGRFTLNLTQNINGSDRRLLHYTGFFKRGDYVSWLRTPPARDPNSFAFNTEFNPVKMNLLVKADTYELPEPEAAATLEYNVKQEGSDKVIAHGEITDISEWYFQNIVQLPSVEPGDYLVEATMVLKDGSKLGPMTQKFTKKDEAKAYPHWWGSNHGDVNRVIAPFTAVKIKDSTVSVWARDYQLNALGLPASITVKGEKVSAGGARIIVVIDGKEQSIKLDGKPTITKATDWRVDFTGQVTGHGLKITSNGWVEQDGLCFLSLTYEAANGKSVKVDGLRIEYPLSQNDADALVCVGPGENYSSRTTKLLDTEKQGQLWSTLETGITGSGMTIGSFYPTVWVGSERRGLVWWADSDKGWVPQDDVPAHEVIRKDKQVVLVNNIIGSSFEIGKARTIEFGYNASPFRPLPDGWRMNITTENGTFYGPYKDKNAVDSKTGKRLIGKFGHINWSHPASRYPEEWADMYAQQKPQADKAIEKNQWADPYGSRAGFQFQHNSWQLMGYGRKSIEDEVWKYFGTEWIDGNLETWNETSVDYMMYMIDRMMGEGGLRTTYWDLTFPILSNNLLGGRAYRLSDGRVQRGYNGFNIRRFYMRLQSLAEKHNLTPGAVGVHSTNAYVMVALPWNDAVLDGERIWNLGTSPLDWVDNMPTERMRALSIPHNWGLAVGWMSVFTDKDKEKIKAAKVVQAEYVWLHDMWRNPYLQPGPRVMPEAVLDWGLNEPSVIYHPYWRNEFVKTDNPDILVSMWQLPDRVVLGVYNYNRDKKYSVKLDVDLKALNLVPEKQWQEFIGVRDLYTHDVEKDPKSRLDFHKNQLDVRNLEPHTIRLIGIRRY